MSLFAELGGTPVKSMELTIPYNGVWHADVNLDRVAAGTGILTLSGMQLVGSIARSGGFVGTSSYRLVGGAGGWPKVVGRTAYRSDFGVKLSTIVNDAARLVGETVVLSVPNRSVGTFYVREDGSAARVLNSLVDLWWVRPDGKTEIGVRSTSLIISKFDVLPEGTSLALGKVTVATDSPNDWQPGRTFVAPQLSGTLRISGVIHRLSAGKLRTEAWLY